MASIRASSEIICHPEFELILEIAEAIDGIENELDIDFFWFLHLMAMEMEGSDLLDAPLEEELGENADEESGTGGSTITQPLSDDEKKEQERLKKWREWRKKMRKEWAKQLRKKGFTKKQVKKILDDLKGLGKNPKWWKLFYLFAKWMWWLKKVKDAYDDAKKKVGEPPEGPPPPPDYPSTDPKLAMLPPC